MKENIMYFNTNLEYLNYIITHAPFVGYVAETKELIYKKKLASLDWMIEVSNNTGIPVDNIRKALDNYTFVDYLQSHGTEWIDTGVKGNETSSIKLKYKLNSEAMSAVKGLLGARTSATSNNINISYASGQIMELDFQSSNINRLTIPQAIWRNTDWHNVGISYERIYWDDLNIDCSNVTEFETPTAIGLLRQRSQTNWGYTDGSIKYYIHTKFSESQYLIPAINSSNKPIMLDLMTMTEYANQGTGTFDIGEVVSLRDKFVEMGYCEPAFTLNTAGNVSDTYDASTGIITRKVGVYDIEDLSWVMASNKIIIYTRSLNSVVKLGTDNLEFANFIKGTTFEEGKWGWGNYNNNIWFYETDGVETFKTKYSGIPIYAELATPYYEDARTGERIEQPSTASIEPMMLNDDDYDTNTEEIN